MQSLELSRQGKGNKRCMERNAFLLSSLALVSHLANKS